jgi:hypothetical protein
MTELPAPVEEAFAATNDGDLGRFVAAFADDGVIDDWGREFRGHEEIDGWSRRESIGVQQTFAVTDVRQGDGEVLVIAEVGRRRVQRTLDVHVPALARTAPPSSA